jgi:AcrR family transcriptional regulator
MGKITYKEKERQRREEEILQKAAQLLTDRGFANLNMDDLADAVGISKPTLYQHFKSKDELVTQVVIENFRIMDEKLNTTLTGTPLQRLQQMMRWMLKSRYSRHSIVSALDQETAWKLFTTNEHIAKGRKHFHSKLIDLVGEAQRSGEIDPALPTSIVVRSMFCLQGALSDPDMKAELLTDEGKLDSAIDAVISFFSRGVTPAK